MKQFSLNIAPRAGTGRSASRRVRSSGGIPAVIYGGSNEPQALKVDGVEFTRLVKAIAGSAAIVEIKQDAAPVRLSIIKQIQRDPLTDKFVHIDLQEVAADREMEVEVTVHAVGECYGVKTENGILEFVSHEVRIRCLPRDLPAFIEVDVTNLKMNESIHVSDLPAIKGVTYLDDPGQSVLAVVEPVAEVVSATPTPGATPVAGAAPAAGAAAPAAGAAAPAAADPKAAGAKAPEKKPADKK